MGDSALRGKYHDREPLAFRSPKKIRYKDSVFRAYAPVVHAVTKKARFRVARFFVASADQHSKIYAPLPLNTGVPEGLTVTLR